MVNLEKEHYVEECAALRKEKEEVEKVFARLKKQKEEVEQVSAQLRTEKEEVEQVSARLRMEKEEVEQVSTRLNGEKEQVEHASARLKTAVTAVKAEVTEQEYRVDQPIEEGLTKVKAIMQELCMKIVDLEARVTPSTPLEEMAMREEVTKDAITSLEAYEAQCLEQYNHTSQVWNQWVEDEELKAASVKVKEVQQELECLQTSMITMPIKEKMATMQRQKQLRQQQDELSQVQRQWVTFIKPLQETTLQTSMTLTDTHAKVHKIIAEVKENVPDHISAQLMKDVLESIAREKVLTEEAKAEVAHLTAPEQKEGQRPEQSHILSFFFLVARDEQRVSVGALLGSAYLGLVHLA